MYEIEFYEDKNGKSEIADYMKELNAKAATSKECRINLFGIWEKAVCPVAEEKIWDSGSTE